tara:strand:+ start:1473 stop:2183 length:711 start_codon:yes stop_codon:yes gene_type:complete
MRLLPKQIESAATVIVLAGTMWLTMGLVSADEGQDAERRGEGSDPKREMWESLTEGEQEKLRNALREVWADPSVISAREDVKQASDAYQNAIRLAVERVDPSVAGSLAKAQKANEGHMKERLGGGLPGRGGIRRPADYPMSPPGFLEKLSTEEREKFRSAEEAAKKTDSVKAAIKALDELAKSDEALRRKRLEAHRRMRQLILDAMVEVDPSLEELQKRLEIPFRSGKGKGKGSNP